MCSFPYRSVGNIIAVFLLAMALVGPVSFGVTPATQPHALIWDFSKNNGFDSLHVSKPPSDDVFYLRGNKDVHLKLRGGLSGNVSIVAAQVVPKDGRVGGIVLFFEPGDTNETYELASKLADEWKFDKRDQIDVFKRMERAGTENRTRYLQPVDDENQPRFLEIRTSMQPGRKPWIVMLTLGFPVDNAKKSATHPASTTR